MLVEHTRLALLGVMKPAAMTSVQELAKLGFRVSGKSILSLAGSPAVRALQAALQRRGVEAVLADGGRDLGRGAHAGGRRSKAVAARRVAAARQRV